MRFAPYGDSALLATAVDGSAEQRWLSVHRLADAATTQRIPGVLGLVATYDSLLVEFDCALTTHGEVERALRLSTPDGVVRPEARVFEIPVVYDGPDLPDVADQLGLPPAEVVRLHSSVPWTVRFLGAPVGAPMMDGSPFAAPITRCPRPRTRVPPGAVAVSGHQAVIYPVAAPGGWRLIGRTSLRLVDITRTPHVFYRPGDVFRFMPT